MAYFEGVVVILNRGLCGSKEVIEYFKRPTGQKLALGESEPNLGGCSHNKILKLYENITFP